MTKVFQGIPRQMATMGAGSDSSDDDSLDFSSQSGQRQIPDTDTGATDEPRKPWSLVLPELRDKHAPVQGATKRRDEPRKPRSLNSFERKIMCEPALNFVEGATKRRDEPRKPRSLNSFERKIMCEPALNFVEGGFPIQGRPTKSRKSVTKIRGFPKPDRPTKYRKSVTKSR
ncbi:hypothetical protein MAR_035685 [Mya arenaria]|uniref:Uncharacterized protein n=1 Tax=Mya arenaria TaxID=6604 RepID=A0ABY7EQD4_MYAAR|nr:hypothetical protein MAR_035685 [Mya arenaria]